ncbi:Wadjet anti-phage system protein JetD domain-containing protein [Acinetobacter towneri]|uniref:Wadjet anti-phage system protein JetD domain-containing protein n=1 Tax=Acinetobacter towneri TaxID=202956 RepID=UPI0025790B55|nr:DUF3322 and DUF2220 domain-containing protein [Acinetobacter towneri]MDM1486000.1 hypothetical protein [Acinetobacter towneri]
MPKIEKWGLLPNTVLGILHKKEWENHRNLKQRLLNQRPFPIEISLRVPTDQQARDNLSHFHAFFKAWTDFAYPELVEWQERQYRQLSEQRVPVKLRIFSLKQLTELLGTEQQLANWLDKISSFLKQSFVHDRHQHRLFQTLIHHLEQIERYSQQEWQWLIQLIEQLRPNMGAGFYLRALPLSEVNTKFLEQNLLLTEAICNVLYDDEIVQAGGLLAWLDCVDSPKGWLMIKPACPNVQSKLGGLPVFQLSTEVLSQFELPAEQIIVVENIQSGLACPNLENSIVVCGGGKNITWMNANWLQHKQVFYWGDIDSEGLNILSMVRQKIPHVIALMMDEATVLQFQDHMVDEPDSIFSEPQHLIADELKLFHDLRAQAFKNRRLEQERISVDWVYRYLELLGK